MKKTTVSEQMQSNLEPITHPTEYDESDDLEMAKSMEHNIYKGRYWINEIKEYRSWTDMKQWYSDFESYSRRLWLDHCDENKAPGCITYEEHEYMDKFKDSLVLGFIENHGVVK
jgi:hypothetical protein